VSDEVSFETVAELLDYPMLVVTTAADGLQAGCLRSGVGVLSLSDVRGVRAAHDA
jgi:hypothetical protein